jgi:ABC-type transporter Mla subunit MlaD
MFTDPGLRVHSCAGRLSIACAGLRLNSCPGLLSIACTDRKRPSVVGVRATSGGVMSGNTVEIGAVPIGKVEIEPPIDIVPFPARFN